MKMFIVSLLSSVILFTACSKSSNGSSTAQYQGNYSGTYSGKRSDNNASDNGTWTMTVAADGKTSGTFTSAVTSTSTYVIIGTVDANGNLTTSFGTSASATISSSFFNGSVANSTAVSGNWNLPVTGASANWTGTFTGSKK